MFDVRNGYPYGTVRPDSTQRDFVPNVGSAGQSQNLQVDAQVDAVTKLTGEVDKLLMTLRSEMGQNGKHTRPQPAAAACGDASPAKDKS